MGVLDLWARRSMVHTSRGSAPRSPGCTESVQWQSMAGLYAAHGLKDQRSVAKDALRALCRSSGGLVGRTLGKALMA